jgi:nicotinamide mononucleotide transporter
MEVIHQFLKNKLSDWKIWEVLWILVSTITILVLSLYWEENLFGIIMAISGVIWVVLSGSGNLSSYIVGMGITIIYAEMSFGAKYYGEVMLNLLYYAPMNVVGWIMWSKHINKDTKEVKKRRMKGKGLIFVLMGSAVGVYVYGLVLEQMGGTLPLVDSMSTVLSVVAQILCVKRFMEQWILWIIIDVVTVIMWIYAFINGGESIATLLMWIVFLLNAVFMFVKWYRESSEGEVNV